MSNVDRILSEYVDNISVYSDYVKQLEMILQQYLIDKKFGVCKLEFRIKDVKSIRRKISKFKDNAITSIDDIFDIIGARIVTFFSCEIDGILNKLSSDFKIVNKNDFKSALASDPFDLGYPFTRLVVEWPKEHDKLVKYKRLNPIKIEIQLCSLAQYTWLQIDDHLRNSIEKGHGEKLREYGNLAYILEMFDSELDKLHPFHLPEGKGLGAQIEEPEPAHLLKEVPLSLAQEPSVDVVQGGVIIPRLDLKGIKLLSKETKMDLEALERFLLDSELVRRMDAMIAEKFDTRLMYNQESVNRLCLAFAEVGGFVSFAEVEKRLYDLRDTVMAAAFALFGTEEDHHEYVIKGTVLFSLIYLLVARKGDSAKLRQFLEGFPLDKNLANKGQVGILMMYASS